MIEIETITITITRLKLCVIIYLLFNTQQFVQYDVLGLFRGDDGKI